VISWNFLRDKYHKVELHRRRFKNKVYKNLKVGAKLKRDSINIWK